MPMNRMEKGMQTALGDPVFMPGRIWNVFGFAYDWRKGIPETAWLLAAPGQSH
jgi:hypothetical protein